MRRKKLITNPQNTKFTKKQKGHLSPFEYKKSSVQLGFGVFGLKILKRNRFTVKQLETVRKYISKHLKKKDILWIRFFPDIPVTHKPKEIRMGKGKGNIDHWVVSLKAGHILFELSSISYRKAVFILTGAAKKLSVSSVLIVQNRKLLK